MYVVQWLAELEIAGLIDGRAEGGAVWGRLVTWVPRYLGTLPWNITWGLEMVGAAQEVRQSGSSVSVLDTGPSRDVRCNYYYGRKGGGVERRGVVYVSTGQCVCTHRCTIPR